MRRLLRRIYVYVEQQLGMLGEAYICICSWRRDSLWLVWAEYEIKLDDQWGQFYSWIAENIRHAGNKVRLYFCFRKALYSRVLISMVDDG